MTRRSCGLDRLVALAALVGWPWPALAELPASWTAPHGATYILAPLNSLELSKPVPSVGGSTFALRASSSPLPHPCGGNISRPFTGAC